MVDPWTCSCTEGNISSLRQTAGSKLSAGSLPGAKRYFPPCRGVAIWLDPRRAAQWRCLLAAWFQGSGERWADDVAILGAQRKAGATAWSKPFIMADVPGFPDINPILFLDSQGELWLMWYTVIANQWETSLLSTGSARITPITTELRNGPGRTCCTSNRATGPSGGPNDRFVKSIKRQIEDYAKYIQETHASQPLQAAATVGL